MKYQFGVRLSLTSGQHKLTALGAPVCGMGVTRKSGEVQSEVLVGCYGDNTLQLLDIEVTLRVMACIMGTA